MKGKKNFLFFLSVFIILILLFFIILIDNNTNESVDNFNFEPKTEKELLESIEHLNIQADLLINKAFSALVEDKFEEARKKISESKEFLVKGRGLILLNLDRIPKDQLKMLVTYIDYIDKWGTSLYKTSNVVELEKNVVSQLNEGAKFAEIIPQLEILERGLREDGRNWKKLEKFIYPLKEFRAKYKITDDKLRILSLLSEDSYQFADKLQDRIKEFFKKHPNYVSVHKRNLIPPKESKPKLVYENVVDDKLKQFFASFDKDHNKKLSIKEAQDFFYYVEDNIKYRYDDENEPNPFIGSLVGDGRKGFDYRQKPIETIREKAGDCEDMATLEQAFYNYYHIPAYVAGFNALTANGIDHAATIVWIADKIDLFKNILGNLVYYEIKKGDRDIYGNLMRPGYYMLVDNAYSGTFGYLSGGLAPGRFKLHCSIPLTRGYGKEWNNLVQECGVEMR